MPDQNPLFEPTRLGPYLLPSRIVMPPLTRNRATEDFVPTPRMAMYYAQRAGAGIQIAEATAITGQGVPYPRIPGIWNRAQVHAWRAVTDAVHSRGGLIFLQLWHSGRVSHSATQPSGELPVAPSSVGIEGTLMTAIGIQPFETPRALESDEIPQIVSDYATAARNAMMAGFDGVEVHGANGYLPDQFLNDQVNLRTDGYGGDRSRRMRFLMEVMDAVTGVWGADRVGVRLSPSGTFMDSRDSDKKGLYTDVVRALSGRGLAYVHFIEPTIAGSQSVEAAPDAIPSSYFRAHYDGTIIVSGDHTEASGTAVLTEKSADLVGFGRPFISNPDLPLRFATGAALAPSFRRTYYSGGDAGYVDYPSLHDTAVYEQIEARIASGELDRDDVLQALDAQPDLVLAARGLYYTKLRLLDVGSAGDAQLAGGLSQVG